MKRLTLAVAGLRACLETTRGAAARDFGCGQGGEFRASPQRAVRNEPTPATDKRPAARRVFGEKAVWLRCSSVEDPPGIFSFVAPRHPAFSPKTAPLVVSKQALRAVAGRQPSTQPLLATCATSNRAAVGSGVGAVRRPRLARVVGGGCRLKAAFPDRVRGDRALPGCPRRGGRRQGRLGLSRPLRRCPGLR